MKLDEYLRHHERDPSRAIYLLLEHLHLHIVRDLQKIMSSIDNLNATTVALKASVDALVAAAGNSGGTGGNDAAVDAASAAVKAEQVRIDAVTAKLGGVVTPPDEPPVGTDLPVIANVGITVNTGVPVSVQLSGTGNPVKFRAESLPPGLSISESGLIAGEATAPGDYSVKIFASNVNGEASVFQTITVTGTFGTSRMRR